MYLPAGTWLALNRLTLNNVTTPRPIELGSHVFHLISVTPLDPLTASKELEVFKNFLGHFLIENGVLEWTYYFFDISRFT